MSSALVKKNPTHRNKRWCHIGNFIKLGTLSTLSTTLSIIYPRYPHKIRYSVNEGWMRVFSYRLLFLVIWGSGNIELFLSSLLWQCLAFYHNFQVENAEWLSSIPEVNTKKQNHKSHLWQLWPSISLNSWMSRTKPKEILDPDTDGKASWCACLDVKNLPFLFFRSFPNNYWDKFIKRKVGLVSWEWGRGGGLGCRGEFHDHQGNVDFFF